MLSDSCHRRLLGLLAVACMTGCASMGAMQRADTLAPGRSQVLVETSIQGAVGKDLGDGERILWPYLAVLYRRGLSERVEWGVGASLLSLKTSLKVRLDDPLQEGVIVSVAPEVGGAIFGEGDSSSGFFAATLPVLLGWRVGQRGQVVLGPRAQYVRTFPSRFGTREPFELFAVGTSLGVVVPVSESFGLMPEVSVMSPLGPDRFELYERLSPQIGGVDGVLFQVGLGLLFGGLSEPQADGQRR
jgi:hypothetical protein